MLGSTRHFKIGVDIAFICVSDLTLQQKGNVNCGVHVLKFFETVCLKYPVATYRQAVIDKFKQVFHPSEVHLKDILSHRKAFCERLRQHMHWNSNTTHLFTGLKCCFFFEAINVVCQ
jgi:hypothetical protein